MLLGCSSGGDDDDTQAAQAPSYEQGRRALCQGFCAGLARCDLANTGDCVRVCIADYQPTGTRGSALVAAGACAEAADCETLGSDDPTKACFDEARAAEPLREGLIHYCESAARAYFRCNNWWSVDDCVSTMGLWDDALLEQAEHCHNAPCNELADCEKSVFSPDEVAK